ncbi:MAG: hypothetical protein K2O47_00175 [Muribaculaceae bacterium]|nr:hypothetical protein [Muribaculaceae bacterium]
MRHILLTLTIAAIVSGATAQDADFEYATAELPVIQLCAVEEKTQDPVPFATITIEYADTIIGNITDGMGLLDFTPRSFPLTLTAIREGMTETTYGITDPPEGPLTIVMIRNEEPLLSGEEGLEVMEEGE